MVATGVGIGFSLVFVVYEQTNCYNEETMSSKVIPSLDNLKFYTYGPSRSSSSTKDIIVVLTPDIHPKLLLRLKLLDQNFADNFTTTLLIMHSSFLSQNRLKHLIQNIQRPTLFLRISTIFEMFPMNFDPCRTKSTWEMRGKWNYQLMIRFWVKLLFELPQLQQYDYMMRLDDDSQIMNNWFNVFDEMRRKRAVYFANDIRIDEERLLPGTMKLQPVTLEYPKTNNITAKQPEMLRQAFADDHILSYANNFEVLQLEFFRRSDVRQWIEMIDQTHGIFKYRWGDAILRYLTIALFADQQEVLHRSDYSLSYCHKKCQLPASLDTNPNRFTQ
ncbi:hypothetical protein I4U23_023023 [Adineta vaga]|nr:hypothetical protein I4U23_023023 [Adineta vaga]